MTECLYRCQCGSFRWVSLPKTTTAPIPICHGYMQVAGRFRIYPTAGETK